MNLTAIITKLKEFIEDRDGSLSSTRLAMLLWVIGTFFIWSYVAISTKTMPAIDGSICTIFSILVAGKVGQKFAENQEPESEVSTVTTTATTVTPSTTS